MVTKYIPNLVPHNRQRCIKFCSKIRGWYKITKSVFDFFLDLIKSQNQNSLVQNKILAQKKFVICNMICSKKGTFSYTPIYLHLIFELSSLMNWIFSLFQTRILQATAGKNPIHQTWYFKLDISKSSADKLGDSAV